MDLPRLQEIDLATKKMFFQRPNPAEVALEAEKYAAFAKLRAETCDCLNACGDDDWLYKGKAWGCEGFKELRYEKTKIFASETNALRRNHLLAALGIEAAPDGGHWVAVLLELQDLRNHHEQKAGA